MRHWGIRVRVLLLALLPTLLISVIIGGYFATKRFENLENALVTHGQDLLKQLTTSSRYGILNQDDTFLQASVNDLLEYNDVISVGIYDANGRLIASAGRKSAKQIPTSYSPNTVNTKDHRVTFTTPIYLNSEQNERTKTSNFMQRQPAIGWINLKLNRSSTELLEYRTLIDYIILLFISLAIAAIFALRLSYHLTQPIKKMIAALGDIKQGKLDTRIKTHAGAELGELEVGLNRMVIALQNAQQELQNNVEQATLDLRETLETIEIQNVELHLARKKALEVSRSKSAFIAKMTHELRTPINGILGFTYLLSDTQLHPHQLDHIETIKKSANHLLSIINNILDLSKIEAGKLSLDQVPTNIRACTEEVLELLAPTAHTRQIELIHHTSQQVPLKLISDPLHYKQIITNLVGNAIKFTEKGSIVIRIFIDEQTDTTARLRVNITDTGIGMTEKEKDGLFKAFSQASPMTQHQFGGTGLGLIICKQLITMMGGEIGIETCPGKGSTFWFTLLCEKVSFKAQPVVEYKRLAGLNVLIHDPHSTAQLALQQLLNVWNMRVRTAGSLHALEQQLSKPQERPVHLVMLGTSQNDPNAEALQETIQRLKQLHSGPLAILVNTREQKVFSEVLTYGASLCIDKPLREQKLYQELCQLLLEQDSAEAALPAPVNVSQNLTNEKKHSGNILIADDNPINLKLLTALLEKKGFNVTQTSNGKDAIEAAHKQHFQLIFLDLEMHQIDGYNTAKAIRKLDKTDSIATPIVAVSAHNFADCKKRLHSSGFNGYLGKPISIQQLEAIIHKWFPTEATFINSLIQEGTFIMSDTAEAKKIIDWPLAEKLAGGKTKLAEDLFSMLIEQLPEDKRTINAAYEAKAFSTLKDLVHSLRGSTCYCGVPLLQSAAEELDNQLKKNKHDGIDRLMKQLNKAIEATIKAGSQATS